MLLSRGEFLRLGLLRCVTASNPARRLRNVLRF